MGSLHITKWAVIEAYVFEKKPYFVRVKKHVGVHLGLRVGCGPTANFVKPYITRFDGPAFSGM